MYTLRALCFVTLFVRPDSCKAEQTKDRLHEPGWGYRYEYGPLPWMPDQRNNLFFFQSLCCSYVLCCALLKKDPSDLFSKNGNNRATVKKSYKTVNIFQQQEIWILRIF